MTNNVEKIKYCIITNNIPKNATENIQSGYQWLNVFEGKILHARSVLPHLKDGDYDIIHIILKNDNLELVDIIRKIIGKKQKTKLILSIDNETDINLPDIIEFIKTNSSFADLIFTSDSNVYSFLRLAAGNILEIPVPLNIQKINKLKLKHIPEYVSVLWNECIKSDIFNIVIKKAGFKIKNFICSDNFFDDTFCRQISKSKIIIIPLEKLDRINGIAEASVLGIPVIAGNKIDMIKKCYPYTSLLNINDIRKIRIILERLNKDKEFYELVKKTAIKNVEYYNFENSKKRLLNALYENKKDRNFYFEKTPDYKSNPEGKINIKDQQKFNQHRSGWNFVIDILGNFHNSNGAIFDGFIESTFCWNENNNIRKMVIPYKNKWVGFFHNPPNMPDWYFYDSSLKSIIQKTSFKKSLDNCLGFFTLSEYAANFIRKETGMTVSSLFHPTEIPDNIFNYKNFLSNSNKKIINIGWWLRKLSSIYLLPVSADDGYLKVRLLPYFDSNDKSKPLIDKFSKKEIEIYDIKFQDKYFNNTITISYLTNDEYDKILSENIVFIDLYDSNANNTIIECIARCTPILINPLPAVIEYLGKDYPFYFNSLEEARLKVLNDKLIKETHDYLKICDGRKKISADYFYNSFLKSDVYRLI